MENTLALGVVGAAILDRLATCAPLASVVTGADLIVRIVDYVPQSWTRSEAYLPYVVVEGGNERPFNTIGAFGSVATPQVRVVSNYRGDAEAAAIMSLVVGRLDSQKMTVSGYASVIVSFLGATLMPDPDAVGVMTRELVAQFDVTVHQS